MSINLKWNLGISETVSYTHLDVYKRQGSMCESFARVYWYNIIQYNCKNSLILTCDKESNEVSKYSTLSYRLYII